MRGGDGGRGAYSDNNNSDTESIGSERAAFSGPLSVGGNLISKRASKKSARFVLPGDKPVMAGTTSNKYSSEGGDDSGEAYVELTLDIVDDSVVVHCVHSAGNELEDPELTLLARKTLEKRSSFGSNVLRNTSNKFRQMSQELRRMASRTRPAGPSQFDRTKSGAAHALVGLKFISTANAGTAAGWNVVERRFDKLTEDTNGLLPSSLFGECIGMNKESNEFAEELFKALARRYYISENLINKSDLEMFWNQITDQSFDTRLQTFFDMVDKDADGRITEAEVTEIISVSASANKLSIIQRQAKEYAALIMEELDPEKRGYIMIYNLETLLLEAPTQTVRGVESKDLSKLLSQKLKRTIETNPIMRCYQKTKYFVMDNWQRVWVMALWLAILAGLFTYKFMQYRNKAVYNIMGYCVCTAKGAAETLKFNMALILLPVCRKTSTWLRNKTKLGVAVPFDDNINFHKVIAIAIAIGVVLHGGAHLTCDFPRLLHATKKEYEPMEKYFGEEQPDNYWWFVKGVEGVTGIVMVVLMVIAFTLAAPWLRLNKLKLPNFLTRVTGFNAFWYSHHLFVIVYTLLIVHGIYLYLTHVWYQKTTWMYLAVPVLLYASERLIRVLKSSIKPVKILKVAVYDGNVLSLHMSKPQGFKYRSGQYMYVNCRAVSPFEWHPFSITSAPGDDYLSVHIRTDGDWTSQLKNVFSEACQPSTEGKSGLLRADFMEGENNPNLPKILIDGPNGAPAQDYKKYEVMILVGLGIGATPMVSIVKDIINNMKNIDRDEEQGNHPSNSFPSTSNNNKKKNSKSFKTRRAYYYWLTREQGSFEWFKGMMNEVAGMDEEGVIELHNYCTSVYEKGDARSALITMLQSLHHAKNGVDVVSGTRVKSHFAKPNWRKVFKKVALHHPHTRVGVFYCGPPPPVKELRQLALDFSHKSSTKFDFHKENF